MTYEEGKAYVLKHSTPEGLDQECLAEYEAGVAAGDEPAEAAACALYEWDI